MKPLHKNAPEKTAVGSGARAFPSTLCDALEACRQQIDRVELLSRDPLGLVHAYEDPGDREVAGLIVALLAYGRADVIVAKARALLERLGRRPANALDSQGGALVNGFTYRFQRGNDISRFVDALGLVRRKHGTLAHAFARDLDAAEPRYDGAASRFVDRIGAAIRGPMTHGLRFLLPTSTRGGAAKRIHLYLRWMIRHADGVDLGTWSTYIPSLDPARLVVPLDTHIHRIALCVGLTRRRARDLRTALEITEALARVSPRDPLKYEMVLCHLGMSGRCARRANDAACAKCPMFHVCAQRVSAG